MPVNFNTSFTDISQGIFGTDASTSGTKTLAGSAQQQLDEMMKAMTGRVTSGQFSKKAAIEDVTGPLQDLINSMMQEAMPSIYGAEKTAGAYSSTTAQQLKGDTAARIAAAGQKSILDAILAYSKAETDAAQAVTGGAAAGGSTTSQEQKSKGLLDQVGGPIAQLGKGVISSALGGFGF